MIRSLSSFPVALARGAIAAALLVAAAPGAWAQEIVQALPPPAQEDLNDALRRLSRNPESVPALVAAGRASLELGDDDAALGFFSRAQAVAPEDGRVLAGLALVAVRRGEAVKALQLFRNAEAAGEHMAPYAAERGLAYDLVGRNDRAQRLYRLALSQEENPEVIRRLALSYAIAGNADASEATLLPLLQRQDRAAYRTRAFALAIRGREEEAIAIAETMLPPRLSARLAPYLRYMPRLTRAQQAAAANLGRFPAANEVGRDSAEIAAYSDEGDRQVAAASPPRPQPAQRLQPQGQPLGPTRTQAPASRPEPAPAPAAGELPPVVEAPAMAQARPEMRQPPAQPEPTPTPTPAQVAVRDGERTSPAAAQAQPSFSLNDMPGTRASAAGAAPAGAAGQEPARDGEAGDIDLAEAFAEFTLESAPLPSLRGAVDITAIDPPRERPAPAEPRPPAHPSRHWVQLGIGQNVSAFRFDLRRLKREADGLLDDARAFTAPWGQTNRLLVGPFATADEAQQMVSALARAGVDSFRFTSREGEEIQPLDR